jgi:hypothetical protein
MVRSVTGVWKTFSLILAASWIVSAVMAAFYGAECFPHSRGFNTGESFLCSPDRRWGARYDSTGWGGPQERHQFREAYDFHDPRGRNDFFSARDFSQRNHFEILGGLGPSLGLPLISALILAGVKTP